jgi:hypothetical protein
MGLTSKNMYRSKSRMEAADDKGMSDTSGGHRTPAF